MESRNPYQNVKKEEPLALFSKDDFDQCKKEWQGMPEFEQNKQKAYAQIIFRFANNDDLQAFAKLIGQQLTPKTKSAWYPQLNRGFDTHKRWADEP